MTALMVASKMGHVDVVKELLNANADIDLKENLYMTKTALVLAIEEGHLEVMRALIEAGANLDDAWRDVTPEHSNASIHNAIMKYLFPKLA